MNVDIVMRAEQAYAEHKAEVEAEREAEQRRKQDRVRLVRERVDQHFEVARAEKAWPVLAEINGGTLPEIRPSSIVGPNGYPFSPHHHNADMDLKKLVASLHQILVVDNRLLLAMDAQGLLHPLVKVTGPGTSGVPYMPCGDVIRDEITLGEALASPRQREVMVLPDTYHLAHTPPPTRTETS